MLPDTTTTSPSSVFDEYVLHHLRRANILARLAANRTNYAMVALRQNWITAEDALGIVAEAGPGLLDLVVGPSS